MGISMNLRKTTPTSETTFLYDGWNLIYEREIAGPVTNETYYYWGKDLSGTLQGAGGVGGLLYLKRNGTIYVPHADNMGNILRYTDTAGNVVSTYTYDAFERTISEAGPLAHLFRHRFSTKYYDAEAGLYYYGYRFYAPSLMRWLNRDPIEEAGGENLYAFCANSPCLNYDVEGNMASGIIKGLLDRIENLKNRLENIVSSAKECIKVVNAWYPSHARDSDANDKYRHCVASCEIANACGDNISSALGIMKEARDVMFSLPQNVAAAVDMAGTEAWLDSIFNGDSFSDNLADLTADVMGIDLKNAKGGCECACKQYYLP